MFQMIMVLGRVAIGWVNSHLFISYVENILNLNASVKSWYSYVKPVNWMSKVLSIEYLLFDMFIFLVCFALCNITCLYTQVASNNPCVTYWSRCTVWYNFFKSYVKPNWMIEPNWIEWMVTRRKWTFLVKLFLVEYSTKDYRHDTKVDRLIKSSSSSSQPELLDFRCKKCYTRRCGVKIRRTVWTIFLICTLSDVNVMVDHSLLFKIYNHTDIVKEVGTRFVIRGGISGWALGGGHRLVLTGRLSRLARSR